MLDGYRHYRYAFLGVQPILPMRLLRFYQTLTRFWGKAGRSRRRSCGIQSSIDSTGHLAPYALLIEHEVMQLESDSVLGSNFAEGGQSSWWMYLI